MQSLSWLKQVKGKPLFEDLLWSRPQTKARAGKILIIGGSSSGFSRPAEAYAQAIKAGAGSIKVALPCSLKSTVSHFIDDAVFCPSNISGSLAKEALSELLDYADWADMVLLSGDLSHNSETAILFETFVSKYKDPLTIGDDVVDLFNIDPATVLNRVNTTLILSINKLQKIISRSKSLNAITLSSNLIQIIEVLGKISKEYSASIVTNHHNNLIVCTNGTVSSTEFNIEKWEVGLSAFASVWTLQNPTKQFEALTTSVYEYLGGQGGT